MPKFKFWFKPEMAHLKGIGHFESCFCFSQDPAFDLQPVETLA